MTSLSQHIGMQIRTYRKLAGMSLTDLSKIICKSKSTVSKYEAGSVVIDVNTLFDIANALQVPLKNFMDYKTEESVDPNPQTETGFFSDFGQYHMYHLAEQKKRIIHSVLEINHPILPNQTKIQTAFYNDVKDINYLLNCSYYYSGEMFSSDLFTNFILQNKKNRAERVAITVLNPIKNENFTFALVSGISDHFLAPIAYKSLISKTELQDSKKIFHKLVLSKDDYTRMKKHNIFIVSNISSVTL